MTTKKVVNQNAVPVVDVKSATPPAPANNGGSGAQSASAPVVGPKGFRAQLLQMLQGFDAAIPASSSLPQVGGALTQASVVAELQSYLTAYTALDTTVVAANNARVTVAQQLTEAKAFYQQLKEALVGFYGASNPSLAQFGLKPKSKKGPLPAAKKAAMVSRMLGTREIRKVMGKVQRKAVQAGPVAVQIAPAQAAVVQTQVIGGAAPAAAPVAAGTAQVAPPASK